MITKIALITGANKGIGFETARQLAGQGMTVLAGARDEERGRRAERALRDGGADARFVQLDVTDAKSVQRAAEWIEAGYGRLDVLVNNAGTASVTRRGAPPSQTSLEDMRAVYEINVFGVVAVTNAMLPLLRRAPAARIVNVSSEVGSITLQSDPASPLGRMPASAQYPSSKAALDMLTVMYAKELRDTPIKVNAANPGYTSTDFNSPRFPHGRRRRGTQRVPGHLARRRPKRNPVGPPVDHRRRRRLRPAALVGAVRPDQAASVRSAVTATVAYRIVKLPPAASTAPPRAVSSSCSLAGGSWLWPPKVGTWSSHSSRV